LNVDLLKKKKNSNWQQVAPAVQHHSALQSSASQTSRELLVDT